MKPEVSIALDAIEQAFGFRLEEHQVLAMVRLIQRMGADPWRTSLRESDTMPWAEVLRRAYDGTKGRRLSRAQRSGRACGRLVGPWRPAVDACRREAGHDGKCET